MGDPGGIAAAVVVGPHRRDRAVAEHRVPGEGPGRDRVHGQRGVRRVDVVGGRTPGDLDRPAVSAHPHHQGERVGGLHVQGHGRVSRVPRPRHQVHELVAEAVAQHAVLVGAVQVPRQRVVQGVRLQADHPLQQPRDGPQAAPADEVLAAQVGLVPAGAGGEGVGRVQLPQGVRAVADGLVGQLPLGRLEVGQHAVQRLQVVLGSVPGQIPTPRAGQRVHRGVVGRCPDPTAPVVPRRIVVLGVGRRGREHVHPPELARIGQVRDGPRGLVVRGAPGHQRPHRGQGLVRQRDAVLVQVEEEPLVVVPHLLAHIRADAVALLETVLGHGGAVQQLGELGLVGPRQRLLGGEVHPPVEGLVPRRVVHARPEHGRVIQIRLGAHVVVDPVVVRVEHPHHVGQAREIARLTHVQQLGPGEEGRIDHRLGRVRGVASGHAVRLVDHPADVPVARLRTVEVVQGPHHRERVRPEPPEQRHEARIPLEDLLRERLVEVVVRKAVGPRTRRHVVLGQLPGTKVQIHPLGIVTQHRRGHAPPHRQLQVLPRNLETHTRRGLPLTLPHPIPLPVAVRVEPGQQPVGPMGQPIDGHIRPDLGLEPPHRPAPPRRRELQHHRAFLAIRGLDHRREVVVTGQVGVVVVVVVGDGRVVVTRRRLLVAGDQRQHQQGEPGRPAALAPTRPLFCFLVPTLCVGTDQPPTLCVGTTQKPASNQGW